MSTDLPYDADFNMLRDPRDPPGRGLTRWPGVHAVTGEGTYPHRVTARGHDTLLAIYALVSAAHLDSWEAWNFQSYECAYHWASSRLSVCNAADGDVGAASSHPNLTLTLPDGHVIEATWDELANKPWRATTSEPLDDVRCAAMLSAAAHAVGRGHVTAALAHPSLALSDPAWVRAHLQH